MKNKTTVEKWEEIADLWRYARKPPTAGGAVDMKMPKQIFIERVIGLIVSSVQEAKAEGAQEAMKEAVNNFKWILEKTLPETGAWVDRDGKPITAEEIAYLVDVEYGVDLLTSLKQEEEKV